MLACGQGSSRRGGPRGPPVAVAPDQQGGGLRQTEVLQHTIAGFALGLTVLGWVTPPPQLSHGSKGRSRNGAPGIIPPEAQDTYGESNDVEVL